MLVNDLNVKINATREPRMFYALHMSHGLAGYEDEDILVDIDAMKRMSPSFQAKPLYVGHQDVKLDSIQQDADGWVVRSFYNENDGCLWAECIAVSDKAHQAIDNGWAVSNAYVPTEWGSGGTFHNIDYNRKIVNAQFTHLALVPDPRYEEAKVLLPEAFKQYQELKQGELKELQNNKSGDKPMFKIFKNEKKEVTNIDADTMVELQNGKSVSLKEMIEAVENAKKNEKKEEEEKVNMDMKINVGDESMSIKELANKYTSMCNKKNEADDEDKKENEAEEDEEPEAKKEADEKKNKMKKNGEKKNSKEEAEAAAKAATDKAAADAVNYKEFMEIKNAARKGGGATDAPALEISSDREKRGKERY